MKQPSFTSSLLPVFAVVLSLFFLLPHSVTAQWDDRSDEAFDQLDSGNSTTWILIGAGAGLATAAAVFAIQQRRAKKQKSEPAETEENDSTAALRSFSSETSRLQQIADVQRRMPVNVLLGVRPHEKRPVVGVAVRF
jgi:hypothetical protein